MVYRAVMPQQTRSSVAVHAVVQRLYLTPVRLLVYQVPNTAPSSNAFNNYQETYFFKVASELLRSCPV